MLTCNYERRVIPAIISDVVQAHIKQLDKTMFAVRAGEILANEGVEFDMDTLDIYVKAKLSQI